MHLNSNAKTQKNTVKFPGLMSREAIVPVATVLAIRSSIEPQQRLNRDRKHKQPIVGSASKLRTLLK